MSSIIMYVVEKNQHGIDRAEQGSVLDQKEVERKFQQWTAE